MFLIIQLDGRHGFKQGFGGPVSWRGGGGGVVSALLLYSDKIAK